MAHKTLIDGTAYKVKGGRTLIDGTGYRITKGRTLIGGTGYDIKFGTPIGELAVGTSVYMNVDGVRTEFIIVNQGKPSNKYDSSCDGTWLLEKNIHEIRQFVSSKKYGYENSNIHSYLNNSFLSKFDSDIQNAISQVKIPYAYTPASSVSLTIKTGANGLSAKIFLLSATEVGHLPSDSGVYNFAVEGTRLDYFSSGSSNNSPKMDCVAYYNGEKHNWWLRTPFNTGGYYAYGIYTDGRMVYGGSSPTYSIERGSRPALVFPFDQLVDDNFNIMA